MPENTPLQPTPDYPLPKHRKRSILKARSAVITALILREMSSSYGRSPGGYIWAILQPLGMILALSVGFSLILRNPSLGTSFFLFYASGFLPFNTYQGISAAAMNALKFSKALLVYPVVSWFDAVIARVLLNALTSFLVGFIIFAVTFSIIGRSGPIQFGFVFEAMLAAVAFAYGIGMVNACIIGFYPAWANIWIIISRPLFLASGVLYIYEDLPSTAQNILWYNPLLHLTGLMRQGFYYGYNPAYLSHAYIWICTMILIAAGLLLLRRFHKEILDN